MEKILLLLAMFIVLPLQSVMAATYYDESSRLKIDFPTGWYEFSEDLYKQIGRENGVAFTTTNGETELYVEGIDSNDPKLQTIIKMGEHLKNTKKDRQKPERYVHSLQSAYGMNISEYRFDANYTRLTLKMIQTSKNFGEIEVISQWVLNGPKMYELKFFKFERTKNMDEQIQYIIDSVKIGDEVYSDATSDMQQSGITDGKIIAQSDQSNTVVGSVIDFLNNNKLWWGVLISLILLLLGTLVYKLA